MITRYTSNGIPVHFPDETSEEVIRVTLARAAAGELGGTQSSSQRFDLSGLRPGSTPAEPAPVDPRAATEARLRAALPPPAPADADDPRPPEERISRSPEWWQSVTGSPDDKSVAIARQRTLRTAEEQGSRAMADLGFEDRATYYYNPTTDERVLKRRRTGFSPPALDPEYRPDTDRSWIDAVDDREARGRGVFPEDEQERKEELGRAVVGGVPGRLAASEAGLLLPLQAVEAVGAGIKQEIGDLASGRLPQRAGESFTAGARRGWSESPITQGAEIINRDIVEPDREWLARAATAAGLSPEASAALDTSQMIAGEALNPGNYIGLEVLRSGAGVARRGAGVLERAADLEARGGARTIETAGGLVTREYGRGMAPSELAQLRKARSGEYGQQEPLIYRDPTVNVGGIKGRIPDAIKRTVRTAAGFGDGGPGELLPYRLRNQLEDATAHRRHRVIGNIPEPSGPRPRPRDIAGREAIQTPIEGGTPEAVEKISGLWDYASRRHPRIAQTVSKIVVHDKPTTAYVNLRDRSLHLGEGADLGVVMHELTHVGQRARMRLPDTIAPNESFPFIDLPVLESTAIRRGEVYGQVPFRSKGQMAAGVGSGIDKATDGIIQLDNGNISDRFVAHLRDNGIDDPDLYYDLPAPRRVELDRAFAASDEGPATGSWNDYLASENLESRDYFALPLPERAKVESRYRVWAAEQGKAPELPEQIGLTDAERSGLAERGHPEFAPSRQEPSDGTLYIDPPNVPLPEEIVAEAMGWKRPMGPPRSTRTASAASPDPAFRGSIDPIVTPHGQTNIAAQLDPQAGFFGDPEVAGYVMEESERVFRAQGPPQSWDTLEEMALRRGMPKDAFLDEASHWSVLSPEVRLRTLYVIKGKEAEISKLQAKLARGEASDVEKAELLRQIEARGDLIRLGVKTGSAYGRALNSLKIEARLALDDNQVLRQQLYRKYQTQLDAEKPLMDSLARLDPSNQDELQAFLRNVDKPTFREYVQEYWVASILSGPATHERNLIGNTVNMVMENAVVRPVSALWDAAAVARTGSREVFLRETPAAIVGLTRGVREGLRRGLRVLKTGYDPDSMKGKLFPVRSAFARSQNRVVREVVGPVVTMPLRLLAASDAVFKSMNFTAEIYAQAARKAIKDSIAHDLKISTLTGKIDGLRAEIDDAVAESAVRPFKISNADIVDPRNWPSLGAAGKLRRRLSELEEQLERSRGDSRDFATRTADLVTNPTTAMLDAADAFALKSTFNDEASAVGKAIINLRESVPVIGGFILPFVKIADRLMVRGFEYTPIGAAKAIGAARRGMNAEAAELAARSSIGTLALAYAASLAIEGRLTAGAPTDEGERAAFYGANKQAWAVRTDDGTWIPYGGLQPVGTPFAIAAAAWKGWSEHGEEPNIEKLGHAAAEIGVYVTDQSYMDALSKFMDAIGGSENERGRAFSDLATNTAWGFAPYSGMTRTVARAIDPRVIDAQTMSDRLRQNVPLISLGMDARLTPWGEDVIPQGGRLRGILAPGSIVLPSREKVDPLDQELGRLGIPLGYVGKSISDKLGSDNRGPWKLSPEEWHFYQQTAGRTTRKALEVLFAKPSYQAQTDTERQRDEVEKAIGKAREYAKIQTVRRHRGMGWN